jgi:hypothetical protein
MNERLREGEQKRDPLDDLIGILEAGNPRVNENGLSFRVRQEALFRLQLLQEVGIIPSDDQMKNWSSEHDEILTNLIESVRADFKVGIYATEK